MRVKVSESWEGYEREMEVEFSIEEMGALQREGKGEFVPRIMNQIDPRDTPVIHSSRVMSARLEQTQQYLPPPPSLSPTYNLPPAVPFTPIQTEIPVQETVNPTPTSVTVSSKEVVRGQGKKFDIKELLRHPAFGASVEFVVLMILFFLTMQLFFPKVLPSVGNFLLGAPVFKVPADSGQRVPPRRMRGREWNG